jgi:hypothetical protein
MDNCGGLCGLTVLKPYPMLCYRQPQATLCVCVLNQFAAAHSYLSTLFLTQYKAVKHVDI